MKRVINKYDRCPCDSKLLYHKCCKPYHDGQLPLTAEQLMRSRYCAYGLNMVDYIIATTHPGHPDALGDPKQWRAGIEKFHEHTRFERLEVREFIDGEQTAYVTFTAHLKQGGEDATFTEKSLFEKIDGRWFYKSGEMLDDKQL